MTIIKGSAAVGGTHWASALPDVRREVAGPLRNYGHPPDVRDAVVENLLRGEALSGDWAFT